MQYDCWYQQYQTNEGKKASKYYLMNDWFPHFPLSTDGVESHVKLTLKTRDFFKSIKQVWAYEYS